MTDHHRHYVAIEGAIGVGKTTLARILSESLGAELLMEVFEENPFLSDFYSDPKRYAFQTQIFFLLSRYRQQHGIVPATLAHKSLVSDYMFDKDRLFAQLTLSGHELSMYERVQTILGERIPTPDLVVFLRASTDNLMQRISFRDRPYERSMSSEYIDRLRLAYEHFFAQYTAAPVLTIDTNDLDIVQDANARDQVVTRVREALRTGLFQSPLLDMEPSEPAAPLLDLPSKRRLGDLQRWQLADDAHRELPSDLNYRYVSLVQGIGELGSHLMELWKAQEKLAETVGNMLEARERALQEHMPILEAELAACLVHLLRLANGMAVDLESSYLARLGPDGPLQDTSLRKDPRWASASSR